MTTSTTSRAAGARPLFRVRSLADELDRAPGPQPPWPVIAGGTPVLAAAATWLIVTGVAILGWVTAPGAGLADAVGFATQIWLLSQGGTATLGAETWTLAPLAVTLIAVVVLVQLSAAAARRRGPGLPTVFWVTGIVGLGYGAIAAAVAALTAPVERIAPVGLTAAALATACAAAGALPAAQVLTSETLPRWLRAVPRGVAAGAAVPAAVGAAVLCLALITSADRVAGLAAGLQLSGPASAVLVLAQLAYLPNAVIWCGSYALGAGFTLGQGTLIAPGEVQLGLLPGIPMFGAVPDTADPGLAWVWLATAIAAGVVASVPVLARAQAGATAETVGAAALAGLLTGGVWVLLAWLSSGDLGTGRLVDLGPRLPQLAAYGPGLIGLAAAGAALVFLVLRPVLRGPGGDRG